MEEGICNLDEKKVKFGLVDVNLRKKDSPIISLFLRSNIFAPLSKITDREYIASYKVDINQNKSEKVMIKCPLLDMTKDFPIWAVVLKTINEKKEFSITLDENDFLNQIGYSKGNINKKNKLIVEDKISKMMMLQLKIVREDENNDDTKFINIIKDSVWDRKSKTFTFEINPKIANYYDFFQWKAIDMEYYLSIKTEYAKALFLYYESHADFVIPIKRDILLDRLCLSNYSRKNNANRKLAEAHESLKTMGFLMDYKENKKNGVVYYEINKVSKKERILLN